jgi:hypothetical protein
MSLLSRFFEWLRSHDYLSNWLQLVVAVLALAVGVTAIAVTINLSSNSGNGPDTADLPSLVPATGTLPSSPSSAAGTASPCRTAGGRPVSCAAADSWLLVRSDECETAAVQRVLGNQPDLRPLLIEVSNTDYGCLARPNALARSIGASTVQLTSRLNGPIPELTECGLDGGQVIVACSQSHTIEMVGAWTSPMDGRMPSCAGQASDYSDRNLVADSELKVLVLQARNSTFRCAIALQRDGREVEQSVWSLGGDPLSYG